MAEMTEMAAAKTPKTSSTQFLLYTNYIKLIINTMMENAYTTTKPDSIGIIYKYNNKISYNEEYLHKIFNNKINIQNLLTNDTIRLYKI